MRKTKLKILSTLILTSLITFISCNDDDLHNHNHERKVGINSRKITFNEFKKHTKAFNVVSEVNRKQNETNNALNKIVKDTINNFTIDTQEGLYLQYANLHSFTFPIQRELNNGKIENLVLSYQNDGSYKVKILQYDLTPQEKADLEIDQLKTIQNPIVTIPIENFDTNLVVNGCETYTELVVIPCSQGVHDAYNLGDWWQCTAQTPGRVYAVSRIRCLVDNGGSNGGGDPLDGGSGDYTGGGAIDGDNNYPPEYPTAQTDPEEYEEGISAPVKPSLDENIPCQDLANKDINPIFNTTLNDLTTKAENQNFESAYALYQNASLGLEIGNEFTGDPNSDEEGRQVNLNLESSTTSTPVNCIGFIHCHLDDGTTLKVFSLSDIIAFSQIAVGSSRPKNEFTMYVTTNSGTFALKVNDIVKFRNNSALMDIMRRELEKDFNELLTKDMTIDKQKTGFLKFIKNIRGIGNLGLDFYEKNNGVWNKLELSSNGGSIIEKPCN